jgi:antitoxin HicB
MTEKSRGRIGSSFDDYLEEDGIRNEVEELALKEIIEDRLTTGVKESGITKSTTAARMRISRR